MKKYTPYIVTTVLFTITIYAIRPKVQEPHVQEIATPRLKATAPSETAPTISATPAPRAPASTPAPTPASSTNDMNQVQQFLNGSQTIKHLVSTNIPELVEETKKVVVPEGVIVRHMQKPGLEYREMKAEGGITVKKLISNGKPLSESYFDPQKSLAFERKYNKDGEISKISLRWSRREGVMLDFYKGEQLAAVVENIEGKSTEQRWDLHHNLIRHQTTGFIQGKAHVVNHLHEPTEEEEEAAEDTESL